MTHLHICRTLTMEELEQTLKQVAFTVAHRFISGLEMDDYRVIYFPYEPRENPENRSGYMEIQKISSIRWIPFFLIRSIVAQIDTSYVSGPDGTRTQIMISLSEDWENEEQRLSQIYYEVAQEFGLPESLHVALVIH